MIKFEAKGADGLEVSKKLADFPKEKPSLRSLMGTAQQAQGCNDEPGALRLYEQALKLYPTDPGLLNAAAWFMLTAKDEKVRDAKRALPLAREAVKLTKEADGNILDTLAKALHDSGELAESVKYAKLAAALAKDNEEIVKRAEEYAKELEQRK
ncbi:MAG: hypothetical protein NTW87_32105 [Planctomycetota bacterium]|nr:hypothetical protein [Planctomycetota bacterium]